MQSVVYVMFMEGVDKTLFYIGSTQEPKKRFRFHLNKLAHSSHSNKTLQDLYNSQDPRPNIYFEILATFPNREDAFEEEKRLIMENQYDENCTNIEYTDENAAFMEEVFNDPKNVKSRKDGYFRWLEDGGRELLSEVSIRQQEKPNFLENSRYHYYKPENVEAREEGYRAWREANPDLPGGGAEACWVNGTEYPSFKAAGDEYGIGIGSVSKRIYGKNPRYKNWQLLSDKGKEKDVDTSKLFVFEGNVFESALSAAKHARVHIRQFKKRPIKRFSELSPEEQTFYLEVFASKY